jgi:hypothetical protein
MIVGQELMERTNSLTFCLRSTDKGSFAHAWVYFPFVRCLKKFLQSFFFSKPPAVLFRTPGELPGFTVAKHCTSVIEIRIAFVMNVSL